jgi:hypothetical protein
MSMRSFSNSFGDDHANYQTDAGTIPLNLRDYMSTLSGHKPEERKLPDKWTAPPFEQAREYIYGLQRKRQNAVHFGTLNQKRLRAVLSGHVKCVGDGEDDLRGKGILNLVFSPHVIRWIPVEVLGSVAATGTAILLDKDQNVWLYNVPNSVDRHLGGMSLISAAQIMTAGDTITDTSNIVFLESYPKAFVELDEVDDDDSDDDGEEE